MFFRRSNHDGKKPKLLLLINQDLCYSCGACVAVCPPDALFLRDIRLTVNQDACTSCERCVAMCPVHALSLVPLEERSAS